MGVQCAYCLDAEATQMLNHPDWGRVITDVHNITGSPRDVVIPLCEVHHELLESVYRDVREAGNPEARTFAKERMRREARQLSVAAIEDVSDL